MSKNSVRIAAFSVIGIVSGLSAADAATINHYVAATNPMETTSGIRDDTATRGVDLDGAIVTARYVDGSSETVTWQALDPWTNGEAAGTDFNVFMGWEGFELSVTSALATLEFFLAPASSLFDMSHAPEGAAGNTPTSHFGFPLELYGADAGLLGNIDVTYSGIVNLAGMAPAGDLFTTMLVDFTGLTTGGFFGDMNFRTDMDTLRVSGDLVSAVPLPPSVALMLVGLAGLGGLGRRRRRT